MEPTKLKACGKYVGCKRGSYIHMYIDLYMYLFSEITRTSPFGLPCLLWGMVEFPARASDFCDCEAVLPFVVQERSHLILVDSDWPCGRHGDECGFLKVGVISLWDPMVTLRLQIDHGCHALGIARAGTCSENLPYCCRLPLP